MGSVGLVPEAEEKAAVRETEEREDAWGGNLDAVLDFDVLCATVALQTQGVYAGKPPRKEAMAGAAREEEDVMQFGGVQRMWEGGVMDCFEDRRIAIEAACCPCYRFGKNMRRANLGSCFLQATAYFTLLITALLNFIAFGITTRHIYLYMGISSTISAGLYLGYFRTRVKKQFNIRGNKSTLEDFAIHLICPCCTLCQESRTLEMNNVHNGIWHGRGDTLCLPGGGERSQTFTTLHEPPLFPTKSPDVCSMHRAPDESRHSWNADTRPSEPLVPSDQLGNQGGNMR